MLPSTGYFKAINCPFYENGYCERPYCHFRHSRRDGTSTSTVLTLDSSQTASKVQNDNSSTIATSNPDVIQQLVSEAVKKVLADQNVSDTEIIVNKVVEGLKPKLVPSVLSATPNQQVTCHDPTIGKHMGVPVMPSPCVYNPTPIAELKKRHIPITAYEPTRESKAVKRKSPDVERPWMDVIRNIACIKESKASYVPTAINQTVSVEKDSVNDYIPTIKLDPMLNLYDINSSSSDSYIPEKKKKEVYCPKPKKRRVEYVPRKPKIPLKTKQPLEDDSYDVLDEFLCSSESNRSYQIDDDSQDQMDIEPRFSDDENEADDNDGGDDDDSNDCDENEDDDDDGENDNDDVDEAGENGKDTATGINTTKEEEKFVETSIKTSNYEKEKKDLKESSEIYSTSDNKSPYRSNKEKTDRQEEYSKHNKEDVSKSKNKSSEKLSRENSRHSKRKNKNDSKQNEHNIDSLKHKTDSKYSKSQEEDSKHSKNKQEDLKHNKNKEKIEEKKDKEKNREKNKDKQKYNLKNTERNIQHFLSSLKDGKNKEKDKIKDNRDSKENSHRKKDVKKDSNKRRSDSRNSKDNKREYKEKNRHKSSDKNKYKSKASSSNSSSRSSKQSRKASNKHSSHKSKKLNNKSVTKEDNYINDKNDSKSDHEGRCNSPEYEEFSPFYDEQLLEISDSDHDVEEECRKIFQEYEVTDHPKDIPTKALSKPEIEEAEGVSKKRVAHSTTVPNTIKHIGSTEPLKRLPNPQQRMYERWRMMKEVAAEKAAERAAAEKLAAEKAAASKVSEIFAQKKSLGNSMFVHNDHQVNGNGKIRIAQVPYAMSLALEKKKVLEKVAKVEIKKTASQNKKGGARIAHIPQVVPQLIRPEPLQISGTQKFPINVRQFYVNAMQNICVQIYTNANDAAQRAVREELACYERCKAVNVYKNSCMLTVHRLRKEVDQKSEESSTSNSGMISHEAVLAGKVKGSWSVIKPRKLMTDFKGALLYNMLIKWILTEQELKDNGYPRMHPEGPKGRAKIYSLNIRGQSNISKVPNERFCCRCNKGYFVDKYGFPIIKENCIFHYARKFTFRGESKYMCCKQDGTSDGCCDATTHVWDYVDAENLRGYVSTLDKHTIAEEQGIFALDCEMCYTTQGLELTRVTVINEDYHVIYETLVKPTHPIIDFNTRFSGISEKDMVNVTTTLLDVQATLLSIFSSKSILIGHSLESDFKALKLLHNTVVDTSIMFPHKNGHPYKRALKTLCSEYLQKIIQNDLGGHNSKEDAIACMELVLWKVKEEAKLQ